MGNNANREGGALPYHFVWEWRWSNRRVYIGWGVGLSPWTNFTAVAGSDLEALLREATPCLDWTLVPSTGFTRPAVVEVAKLLRKVRRNQGFTLVRSRPYAGAGLHPVPLGGYRSMRAAARALGISRYAAAAAAGRPYRNGKTRRSDFNDSADSTA